ncbi:MAG TPA: AsnC family protein, partial [Azospira sp.]|nr:AsnC family protein [Azospira sp.]
MQGIDMGNKRNVAALDATDCRLLELLQADARITNVALAEAVHLSLAPISTNILMGFLLYCAPLPIDG